MKPQTATWRKALRSASKTRKPQREFATTPDLTTDEELAIAQFLSEVDTWGVR